MEGLDPNGWPFPSLQPPTRHWLRCQSGFLETNHLQLIDGAMLLQDFEGAARVRDVMAPLEPIRKKQRTKEQSLFTRGSEPPLQARFTIHDAITEADGTRGMGDFSEKQSDRFRKC